MHRPTTTATLLITVAVSALTGCVTAQHPPPAPQTSPVPARPPEPRPDGTTATQIVQAPAREALALVGPPREPTPSASTAPRPTASTPAAATPTTPPPRREERQGPPDRPGPPPESRPHIEIPPLPETIPTRPPKYSDICALGHTYGGWGKDTPQAAICKNVYGR